MTKPRLRLITSLLLLSLLSRVPAEVITDGTVGPQSTLSGPDYEIGHDLGTQSGTNLYHSFDKFNLNAEESATFTGPLDINNVFGRVTGGESLIDGQISSDMPNADIYLINPHGMIFGQNASLDVPGSFYASTADQIILKDGTTFSATNPQNDPPILSAEPFSAFGFLDDNTALISITGGQFQAGKTFALVGGEITIENANISGGQGIEIDSRNAAPIRVTKSTMKVEGEGRIFFRGGKLVVTNNSTIQVDSNSANSRIEVDATDMQLTDSIIRLKAIGESDAGSLVIDTGSLSLTNSFIGASTQGTGKAGDVKIKAANSITLGEKSSLAVSTSGSGDAGKLDIETGSLSLTNSFIGAATNGTGNAGDVQIKAANSITLSEGSVLGVETQTQSSGDAGSLDIETDSLSLTKNSKIEATTDGTGKGGDVQIKAANSITLSGESELRVETQSSGDAGSLDIETGSLSLTNSKIVATTKDTGKGGDVQIKAANNIIADNSVLTVSTLGSGDAGKLDIETGSLSLTNSSLIGATTSGTGNGGDVQIKAANSITLSDNSVLGVETQSSGDAGSLDIDTGSLSLTKSEIVAITYRTGKGGDVQIKAANNIIADNSVLIVGTFGEEIGSGDAGSLDIETGSLSLTNSDIEASTSGTGKGGDVHIETGSLSLTNSLVGAVTSGAGNAGEVQIKAANSITLENASVLGVGTLGSGDAGSLDIETGNLSLTNSLIGANPSGTGNAGDIQIKAANSIISEDSILNATTFGSGHAGSVDIETGSLSLTNSHIVAGTEGTGNAGDVQIKAANSITLSEGSALSVGTVGSGDAGSVDIETSSLSLTNSKIRASTFGTGSAGKIAITASEYIEIFGENSGIFSASGDENFPNATGNAGTIIIGKEPVGTLTVTEGGQISTTSWGAGMSGEIDINLNNLEINQGGRIDSSSKGTGSAGKITITASEYIKIFGDSGIFSTTDDIGNAGQINILAGGTPEDGLEIIPGSLFSAEAKLIPHDQGGLVLENGGKISTSTTGQGDGGSITITSSKLRLNQAEITADNNFAGSNKAGNIVIGAHRLDMSGNSTISTSSTNADGGNILIGVRELNNKRITDSQIAATAGEKGTGGNLEIRGPKYLILDSTDLSADADKGGNLTVDADVFIASSDSQVQASGVLQTPEHIDVGTISLLPNQGVDASKMIKECTAYDSEEEWSLMQVGYGERKKGCIK
jgi:filamentous hemagglutinin family protein